MGEGAEVAGYADGCFLGVLGGGGETIYCEGGPWGEEMGVEVGAPDCWVVREVDWWSYEEDGG